MDRTLRKKDDIIREVDDTDHGNVGSMTPESSVARSVPIQGPPSTHRESSFAEISHFAASPDFTPEAESLALDGAAGAGFGLSLAAGAGTAVPGDSALACAWYSRLR